MPETAIREPRLEQFVPALAPARAIGELFAAGRDRIVTVYGPEPGDPVKVNLSVPVEARVTMVAAISAMDGGQPVAALDLLMSVEALAATKDASWHYLVGAANTMLRRHHEARKAFQASLRIQPDSFTVRMCLAYSEMLLKSWPRALSNLKVLAKQAHSSSRRRGQVWFARGLVFLQTSERGRAEEAFRRSIELTPTDPRPYDALALLYATRAKNIAAPEVDQAIALYRKLTAERPDLAEPLVQLGALLVRRRDFDGALACFRQALAIDPRSGDALVRMGGAFHDAGRLEEGIRVFEGLAERSPDDVVVLDTLGALYGTAGRHREAAAVLQRALDLGSPFATTHANLGASFLAFERYVDALNETLQALEIDPNLDWAHQNLSEILNTMIARAEESGGSETVAPVSAEGSDSSNFVRVPGTDWEAIKKALSATRAGMPLRVTKRVSEPTREQDEAALSVLDGERRFEASMRWLDQHKEKFEGQWVALDGDRLVSHGMDPRAVFREARDAGVMTPLIERVEPKPGVPFGGW